MNNENIKKIDIKTALKIAEKEKSDDKRESKFFVKNDEKNTTYLLKNLPMNARYCEENCEKFLIAVVKQHNKKLSMNDFNNVLKIVLNSDSILRLL